MRKHEDESKSWGERLKQAARVPLVATLGAGAIWSSQADVAAKPAHFMPPFAGTDQSFKTEELVASATLLPTSPASHTYQINILPPPFAAAIERSLSDPIVSLGAKLGRFNKFNAYTFVTDNGSWDAAGKDINLLLSSGRQPEIDRVFFDDRMVEAAVDHEAFHGINEAWYRYIRAVTPTSATPAAIREADISLTEAQGETLARATPPCNYDTDSEGSASMPACFDEKNLDELLESSFHCIDEGFAAQELLQLDSPIPMGHPYDSASEVGSSVLTILRINPSYIERCFGDDHSPLTQSLRTLTRNILNLSLTTTPELEPILRADPVASRAIDDIRQVS